MTTHPGQAIPAEDDFVRKISTWSGLSPAQMNHISHKAKFQVLYSDVKLPRAGVLVPRAKRGPSSPSDGLTHGRSFTVRYGFLP